MTILMDHPTKYQDESWAECAERLGREARFEGKDVVEDCPFPRGWLAEQWARSWKETDADIMQGPTP